MGLYWVDKIDGTDDYIAKDVNDLAHAIQDLESGKVDKADGKVLSSNDFTDEDKAKLDKKVDKADGMGLSKIKDISLYQMYLPSGSNGARVEYKRLNIETQSGNDISASYVPHTHLTGFDHPDKCVTKRKLSDELQAEMNKISTKADKSDTYTKDEVDSKISRVYRIQGTTTCSGLSTSSGNNAQIGDVYNISDQGIIDTFLNTSSNHLGHMNIFSYYDGKCQAYYYSDILPLASTEVQIHTTDNFEGICMGGPENFCVINFSTEILKSDGSQYTESENVPLTFIQWESGSVLPGDNVVFTENGWDVLSASIDLSKYVAKEDIFDGELPVSGDEYKSVPLSANQGSTLWHNIIDTANQLSGMIATKQDSLTFDEIPTDDSENPVTSAGIKAALDECVKNDTLSTGTGAPASDGSTKAPFPGALYINTSNGDIYRCDEITNSMPPGTYFYSWSKLPVSIPYASDYNKGGMVTIPKDKGLILDGPGGALSLAVAGADTLGGIKVKHPSQSYLNIDENGFLSVASENFVIDDITETSTTKALSANMGRHLLELINMKLYYGGKIGGMTFDNQPNGYIYQIPADGTYVVNLPPETSSGSRQSDTTIYVNTLFSVDFMVGAVVKLKVNSTEAFYKITAAEIDNGGAVLTLNKSIAEGASIEVLNFAKSYSLKAKDIVLCDRQEGLILLHRDYSTIISALEQRIEALEQKEV